MSAGIERDLSRKMQMSISEVLDRETKIASYVLDLSSIGIIMFEAAVMVARTTAATLANSADTDEAATAVYNATIDQVIEQLQKTRADGIERTLIARKARAA